LQLTFVDWLIMLLYFVFVLGIGFALKRYMKTSKDFFQAGRALPAWICGLAFISANLGAQEVIGMGASGAKYGLETAHFYGIGAIPAMVFVGIFMMPFYYGSKARSVPEFLLLRFDEKTRALNACSFAVMTVFSSGISMYAMARLIQALHVFDGLFRTLGWAPEGIFTFSIVMSAVIVLLYIFLGGLTSAIYNEVLQFFLIIAGFLPLVLLGLKNVGGWNGLKMAVSAVDPRMMHEWHGVMHASTNPMGIDIIGIGMGLGFVLGSGYWCTDFLVIQTAMASHNMKSARRVPLIAAVPKMVFPFLVIVPGLIAISLPTPRTVTTTHEANGVIYHDTTVVPKIAEEGRGIIPAKINPVTGKAMLDASGKPLLDYDMATPNMLLHYFPTGILGLGLTALLASFMSGMAGNVTAFNTVFTYDLYQS
jgi:solute:Na+ symporter, SSS family